MAHSMGAIFHLPHGRLVGLALPYTIEFTANGGGTRYGELARFLALPATDEAEGTQSLVAAIRRLARSINQPLTIGDLGIPADDFERVLAELVTRAADDPQMLTSLRAPDNDELEGLFRCAFDGRAVDF
jgi:acetaldehyde dehydrogenase/alcohol dehydrogenase